MNLDIVPPLSVRGILLIEEPARLGEVRVNGRCSVGAFTYFNGPSELNDVEIGRYCSFGQNVLIAPGHHPTDFVTTHPLGCDFSGIAAGMAASPSYCAAKLSEMSHPNRPKGPTFIGHDVWCGARSIVLRGVTVGIGAIIGAASVVTRNVAPYSIVAGSPARHLRWRFGEEMRQRLLASEWWTFDLSGMTRRDYSDPERFLTDLAEDRTNGNVNPLRPKGGVIAIES